VVKKKSSDINVFASQIVAEATQEEKSVERPIKKKNPATVVLGRLGGLKGGKARAEKLSPIKRKKIAKKPQWQDGLRIRNCFCLH
jgi:hypothetical protein